MNKFGIVGEGYTDKVVIENVLRGFFTEHNLEDEINHLPESEKGGWQIICEYLTSEDFRNDVLSHETLVIQIDTDITTKEEDARKFGVFHRDEQGNELTVEALLAKVRIQLISQINTGEFEFYEQFANKIIFAISVHSTECWLVAYYSEDATIHDCDKKLLKIRLPKNIQFSKKQRSGCHAKLSEPFLSRDTIVAVAQKSPSFNSFIQQLQNIQFPDNE
jgi:hypothetical protein